MTSNALDIWPTPLTPSVSSIRDKYHIVIFHLKDHIHWFSPHNMVRQRLPFTSIDRCCADSCNHYRNTHRYTQVQQAGKNIIEHFGSLYPCNRGGWRHGTTVWFDTWHAKHAGWRNPQREEAFLLFCQWWLPERSAVHQVYWYICLSSQNTTAEQTSLLQWHYRLSRRHGSYSTCKTMCIFYHLRMGSLLPYSIDWTCCVASCQCMGSRETSTNQWSKFIGNAMYWDVSLLPRMPGVHVHFVRQMSSAMILDYQY